MEYKIKTEADFVTYLSAEQLTMGDYNRYELVIAVAKAARNITDMRYSQREEMIRNAESNNFEQDKTDFAITNENAVSTAILKIYNGELVIVKTE